MTKQIRFAISWRRKTESDELSVAPKRPKGPPLNAMRAFEAAARHVSFIEAAEELNVTPGAISQHVKALEGWAGVPLFNRQPQGVELTSAGRALVGKFSSAFDELAEATRALHNLGPNVDFHIAALPSIAQLWLPKRLSRIRQAMPNINFSVTALETPPVLKRELFDLSIFFGSPEQSPDAIILCPDVIQPVCSPALFKQLQSGVDFRDLPSLHDQTWAGDWSLWSDHTGIALDDCQSGPHFSLFSLAVEEAKAGAGLLMGHLCLIEDALDAQTLVTAHNQSVPTGRSLIVNLPDASQRRTITDGIVELLRA